MTNNFITDNEIDRILGRITEYRKAPESKPAPDRYNISVEEKARLREEYSRKKAQEFATSYSSGTSLNQNPSMNNNMNSGMSTGMNMNTNTNTSSSTNERAYSAFTSVGVSAGVIRRVYAFCTDLCVVGMAMVGFVYGAMYFTNITSINNITWMLGGLYAVLFVFYLAYFEGLIGQTPGKMFLNVKVVDSENKKPKFSTMILRTLLFCIPPLGLFGLHNVITKTRLVMND
ncbi:MAG: RDD family protein [bacterium]